MSFTTKSPIEAFSSNILQAIMWVGRRKEDLVHLTDLPIVAEVNHSSLDIHFGFDVIAYTTTPLPDIQVDELTITFQLSTFYVTHIRNWTRTTQVLSTIRTQKESLTGWSLQHLNISSIHERPRYFPMWSEIDLPHTTDFQEQMRWIRGYTWEQFYSSKLFFIPEMFTDN
jgi:hypothetical protein